jgi:hypothetical protein
MAIVLVLSTLILHTVSQSDAAANDNALMKDISGAQQAAFDAVTAGGAGNENILVCICTYSLPGESFLRSQHQTRLMNYV